MSIYIKGEKPDYAAMAEVLVRIARELRQHAGDQASPRDLEQAERLERIAAVMMGSGSA